MRKFILFILISIGCFNAVYSTSVTGILAVAKNGQVFITWTNLTSSGIDYILYKSTTPIQYGYQLNFAQNLGYVHDSSSLNKRLSLITGHETYLKIDSAASPVSPTEGLFVATTTENDSFYYAIVTDSSGIIDTTINTGQNSLSLPVTETVSPPAPVWQQSYTEGSNKVQVYVQFTSMITSATYPQMTNQGSFPFNFAICAPAGGNAPYPVEIRLHGGGGNFLEIMAANFNAGSYGVGLDDWVPEPSDYPSGWFGFNQSYDVYSNDNSVPDSGTNDAFTLHREVYTLNWIENRYPIDTTRVCITGTSMGGTGALLLAMYIPGKIAFVATTVPKVNLALLNDPDTGSAFNAGTNDRLELDTMWGQVPVNLPTDIGYNTYDFLNVGNMMSNNKNNSLPVIFVFSGKNDSLTGWDEKITFYDSVNTTNAGGYYFWDMEGHNQQDKYWEVIPEISKYSTNTSYPAFSNCSINNNPGDGYRTNGDTVGTINGYLDWTDSIIDQPQLYKIQLLLKNLLSVKGIVKRPDSCTTTITLRRLQQFNMKVGDSVLWQNNLHGNVVQSGSYIYKGGSITIPGIKVYKDTNTFIIQFPQISTYAQSIISQGYSLQLFPIPSNGNEQLSLQLQQPMKALTINLINLTGQIVQTWNYTDVVSGFTTNYDLSALSKGEYLLQLVCNKFTSTEKLILQ